MKKVLSFALVLALILGSFSMVFAADFSDVESSDPYAQAVDVLTGLGIVSGYKDGTYKPEKVVTRAEMAALIINALGLPVSGTAQTRFSDVPATHWASGFVNYAASMNIISGYPDGTFKPDKTVSYDEALTMVINAIGYNADSVGSGAWPGVYINRAFTLGLLDTSKSTGSVGANRGDIACILFDALNIPLGATNKVGEFVADAAGKNTFAKRNNADDFTPKSGVKGGEFIVEGTEASLINLKPYVGANATATAKDGKIISLNVLSTFVEGKITTVGTAHKLAGYTLDFDPTGYQVEQFTNGKIGAATVNVTTGATLKFAVDINGNYITKIHSEIDWTSANVAKLTAADVGDISKAKLLTKSFLTDKSDKIVATNFDLLGVDSLADIKKDNVVKVYDDGTWITRIEVGTQVVEGTVTEVSSAGKVTIGGTAYAVSAPAADEKAIKTPGAKGSFYLDYDGDIYHAVFEEAAAAETYYGLVLELMQPLEPDGTVDNTKRVVKMVLADGTSASFNSKTAVTDAVLGLGAPAFGAPKTVTGITLVSYQLDSKGAISKIVLATADPAMTQAAVAPDNTKVSSAGLFDGKIVTDKTLIVNVPATGTPDWANAKTYTILKKADILGETSGAANNTYYTLKSAPTQIEILVFGWDAPAAVDTTCGIVVDYKSVEDKRVVTALVDGKEVEYDSELDAETEIKPLTVLGLLDFTITDGKFTAGTPTTPIAGMPLTLTEASSVNGSFFVDNTAPGTVYTLSSKVVVYINDGGEWSVGSVADLDGLKGTNVISLYDVTAPADNVIDIVVVNK